MYSEASFSFLFKGVLDAPASPPLVHIDWKRLQTHCRWETIMSHQLVVARRADAE